MMVFRCSRAFSAIAAIGLASGELVSLSEQRLPDGTSYAVVFHVGSCSGGSAATWWTHVAFHYITNNGGMASYSLL